MCILWGSCSLIWLELNERLHEIKEILEGKSRGLIKSKRWIGSKSIIRRGGTDSAIDPICEDNGQAVAPRFIPLNFVRNYFQIAVMLR